MPSAPERGAATAQLVIVFPVLLFMILVIVQFGLWYHGSHVARAAAQEGARAARLNGGDSAAGKQAANQLLGQVGENVLTAPQVNVTVDPDWATVVVDAHSVPLIAGFSLPIHAESRGPVERFRAADE